MVRVRIGLALVLAMGCMSATAPSVHAFPAYDDAYHTYEELTAAIHDVQAAHPGLVVISSIGRSHEGREIWIGKVSDNVAADEGEAEILIDGGHHGGEHLSVEMALAMLQHLAGTYATDAETRRRVDSTETWIVFNLNPDGTTFDGGGATYRGWRKNRQPTPGTGTIGTDLNRNYAFGWGCCGGSSGDPGADTYRGPSLWSAPEVRALRDFVDDRVIGGRQQIRVHLSFHSAGRLIVWPWAHTTSAVADGNDRDTLAAIGSQMAGLAGYGAMQSSHWYPTDGDQIDWMYDAHRIFSYTVELADRPYPPDEMIPTETARALPAVLHAMDVSGCPWEVIGAGALHCPPDWVTRLAGADRYATAAAVSAATFAPGIDVAYVATGRNYPDALAGGAAAAAHGAPILLTRGTSLSAATLAELDRLRPGQIVVLGGPDAVSDGVVDALRGRTSGGVTRLAGADRYATAAAASAATFAPGVSVAYVATGTNFPDALAAVPLAGVTGSPLLLVQPDAVPPATAAELERLRPARIVILGGPNAVSDATAASLASFTSGPVSRIAGSDRYATAAAVAATFAPGVPAYLATGTSFADALAGGPAAAAAGGPVVLATRTGLPAPTAQQLDRIAPGVLHVLGGLAAVSDEVAAAAGTVTR